ncbi:hypothetical protein H310_10383 [Aphanomyces invadans]|uniref:Uncharacterized protein n=1 Tax=Aphanomyces invadans TaxID=157072 RepID=A0A024TQA5_9STRA|nr:hypothetical protein H310_10383 [Aphanomyces invadans]ETV96189.1 hypothetical protein H310_10383 [Aphanomyces invadans]|eukprot:XP_008874981.1 hypothetical protein H310_10383 [Aphanomyces invadans]
MHRVSDHLEDRYPYRSGFREENNENDVSRAYGSQDIARYCRLLSLKEELTDEDRVKALTGLVDLLANQENKTKAVAAGVVASMSRLMTVSNHDIRLGAATVVAAIAWDADGLVAMDKDPTLMFNLNSLLFDANPACIEMATQVLVNLTTNREGIPIVLARSYIREKLVAMATGADTTLTTATIVHLYQIFAQLTKSQLGAQACAEVHVVPALIRILHNPLLFPAKLLRHVVQTVWNLATHNEGKVEAISLNVVELLIKVLTGAQKHVFSSLGRDAELDLIRITSGALMALATAEVAKPKLLATGIDPLVACLFVSASRQNAIQALNYMCEERSGLLSVVTLLLDHPASLLVEVFGVRAMPALNTLLEQELKPTPIVLQAIADVCTEEGGVDQITQCLHMLDNLTKLCEVNTDIPRVPELATGILKAVAEHDDKARGRVERALERNKVAPAFVKSIL